MHDKSEIKRAVRSFDHALGWDILAATEEMETRLRSICESCPAPWTPALTDTVCGGGKRLRPMLAYVCCRMGKGGEIVPLMTMLELMHSASLIHDDVVDAAALRRGRATLNSLYGDRVALAAGDYLLSRAMMLLRHYRGRGINELLAEVSRLMSEGELHQQSLRFMPEKASAAEALEAARLKTACLISAACRCGAMAGDASPEEAEALGRCGERLGLAFQLRDDLLDFAPDGSSGKARCQDLRSGTLSTPIALALETEKSGRLRELFALREKSPAQMQEALSLIELSGALEKTKELCDRCSAEALEALDPLRSCSETAALRQLALELACRTN